MYMLTIRFLFQAFREFEATVCVMSLTIQEVPCRCEVRAKKLKTMMTLFHHSAPIWTDGNSGWASKTGEVVRQFLDFALAVAVALRGKIDYWTTSTMALTSG